MKLKILFATLIFFTLNFQLFAKTDIAACVGRDGSERFSERDSAGGRASRVAADGRKERVGAQGRSSRVAGSGQNATEQDAAQGRSSQVGAELSLEGMAQRAFSDEHTKILFNAMQARYFSNFSRAMQKSYPKNFVRFGFDCKNQLYFFDLRNGKKECRFYFSHARILVQNQLENWQNWRNLYSEIYSEKMSNPAKMNEMQIHLVQNLGKGENRRVAKSSSYDLVQNFIFDTETRIQTEANLVRVEFLGQKISVHYKIRAPLKRVEKKILVLYEVPQNAGEMAGTSQSGGLTGTSMLSGMPSSSQSGGMPWASAESSSAIVSAKSARDTENAVENSSAIVSAKSARNPDVERFFQKGFVVSGYNWREVRDSYLRSSHSWGLSVDIMPKSAGTKQIYWRWSKGIYGDDWVLQSTKKRWAPPQKIIQAFESEGFIWGGYWELWDNMHFEYHPEILNMQKAKSSV